MEFLSRTFRVGRLFGVNVHVHVLFLIYVAWQLIEVSPGGGSAIREELVFFAILFGLVLIHEYGHCFGARAVGGDARDILLWPLGGIAFAGAPMTPWAQFVTVAAGPLVNVVVCLATWAVLTVSTGTPAAVPLNPFSGRSLYSLTAEWEFYVWRVFHVSYLLFLFNMLPVFPMDGGQLLRAVIWPALGLNRATIVAAQVGIVGAVLFGVWGVSSGAPLMVVIAIWGGMTAYQHLAAARHGLRSEHFVSIDRAVEQAGRTRPARRGLWSRWFGGRRPRAAAGGANPNPGAWERRGEEERSLEAELDRILRKVSEEGLHSLSYVERQTLQHATRLRQQRERELGRTDRL